MNQMFIVLVLGSFPIKFNYHTPTRIKKIFYHIYHLTFSLKYLGILLTNNVISFQVISTELIRNLSLTFATITFVTLIMVANFQVKQKQKKNFFSFSSKSINTSNTFPSSQSHWRRLQIRTNKTLNNEQAHSSTQISSQ